MDDLPVNGAPQAEPIWDTSVSAADEVARMLAEETRRIQGDTSGETQLIQDETILLGDFTTTGTAYDDADRTELAPAVAENDVTNEDEPLTQQMSYDVDDLLEDVTSDDEDIPRQTSAAGTLPGSVPGVIPIDETVVRPMAVQSGDEHFVVRNTRDYDHDAQSVNVVAATENFDTITEPEGRRGKRRERKRDPYAHSAKEGRVPGEGNSRSKLRPLLAMFIIALVLGGGAAVASYGMEMWGGKTVPNLVGDSQEAAEAHLRDKGLVPHVEALPADEAIGKVIEQKPDAGTRIPEGDEVTIVIATNRTMPDVVGMSEEEALAVLREAGAENVISREVPSDETLGMVLEVSPAAGEAFVSHGEVVLSIAGWYHVPDVVGKKEQDALDEIEAAGLQGEIHYIVSSETVRTVVETEPAAGEPVSSDTVVQVRVSTPYPTDIYHLSEYFQHSSQDIDSFLEREEFRFDAGHLDGDENAVVRYLSDEKGTLTFSSRPLVKGLSIPQDKSSNVLSTGAPFAGIRLDGPKSLAPQGRDAAAVEGLAGDLGLTGIYDKTDNANANASVKQQDSAAHISVPYACAVGRMDGLVWTILVAGTGDASQVVVTCGKEGIYTSIDLGGYNNSLARYVVVQELGQQATNQNQNKNNNEKKDAQHDNTGNNGANNGREEPLAPGV